MASINPNYQRNLSNTTRVYSQKQEARTIVARGLDSAAAIILDKCDDINPETDKFEYHGKNGRISLLVGTNSSCWPESLEVDVIDYGATPAGFVIAARSNPYQFFNPVGIDEDGIAKREWEKGIRQLAVPSDVLESGWRAPKVGHSINNAEPAATLWAGTVNLVAFNGGVNIYTKPWAAYPKNLCADVDAEDDAPKPPPAVGNMGVSLIHNNLAEDLEPMVLGNKLEDQLTKLWGAVRDLQGRCLSLGASISGMVVSDATHFHFNGPAGPGSPSPQKVIEAVLMTPGNIKDLINDVGNTINHIFTGINQLNAFKSSFKSRYHKLN